MDSQNPPRTAAFSSPSLHARWRAGWDPARPAIVTDDATWTFGALDDRVRRAATWLRGLGVRPGDVVALAMGKAPSWLAVNLGCAEVGAVCLPLNDRYTPRELAIPLADAPARVAIVPDAVADAVAGPWTVVPAGSVDAALDAAAPAPPSEVDPDAIVLLLYTSGTTGRPKGVPLRARQVEATVDALHAAWGWSDADTLLHALPLYHVHGLIVAAYGAMRAGATSHWTAFEPTAILERLARGPATVFMGVPTFHARMVEVPGAWDLRRVRLLTSGSAGLPARVHAAAADRFGAWIVERYGMTEVGIVTSNPIDGGARPGSIGRPLPGVGLRIVDPATGLDQPTDAIGELWIRAGSVFDGYHGLPDATGAAFTDGWFHTGDLGHVDADGFVVLAGRRSELVIVGGFNVYPAELEAVLLDVPGVREAAVTGIPDPDLGEVPVAAVVGDVDLGRVRAALRAALAPYKIPRRIHRVEALPRNAMGKVLKQRVAAGFATAPLRDEVGRARAAASEAQRAALDRATIDVALAGGPIDPAALATLAERWPGGGALAETRAAIAPLADGLAAAVAELHRVRVDQHRALHAPEHAATKAELDALEAELVALDRARTEPMRRVAALGPLIAALRQAADDRDRRPDAAGALTDAILASAAEVTAELGLPPPDA
ncbi:MAG: AMP-binding protein, partial [Myxococcota bacterium]